VLASRVELMPSPPTYAAKANSRLKEEFQCVEKRGLACNSAILKTLLAGSFCINLRGAAGNLKQASPESAGISPLSQCASLLLRSISSLADYERPQRRRHFPDIDHQKITKEIQRKRG